jgi:DNA processing protein
MYIFWWIFKTIRFCNLVVPNLMKTTELIATLVLPKLPKIGCSTARKLIRHFGSAEAVFQRIGRENSKPFNNIAAVFKRPEAKQLWGAAEKEVAQIKKHRILSVAHNDPDFPIALNLCPDAPLVLFGSGQAFPNTTRVISIVGTRMPSPNGKAFVRQLVETLAPYQPVIVSGFAHGIDITAQLAALENNLITYGCLGHGILNCYPREHQKHRKKMEQHGGFLTELWSHEQIKRSHFLQRNRIIAGLAQATIVVESKSKGGALTTAAYALGYERDVFAVPGRPNDSVAQGCLALIKAQKATCITSGADVAQLLGWKKEKATAPQRQLFVRLNDKEQQIIKHMSATPKHIDLIALDASLKISDVSSLLFQLEMKGVVMAQAGKLFKLL